MCSCLFIIPITLAKWLLEFLGIPRIFLPVEVSWLLTDSILKFWLPDTKVEVESLQVGLSLQNLQNIQFPSESYVSHVKSFNHDRTNFRSDKDWHVEESSIPLFEVEVVDVWDDSEDFDDDRNALISTITRGISNWLLDMWLDPMFPRSSKSIWRRTNTDL